MSEIKRTYYSANNKELDPRDYKDEVDMMKDCHHMRVEQWMPPEEVLEEYGDMLSEGEIEKLNKIINMKYDSTTDTLLHIKRVSELLSLAAQDLLKRGICHDESKLGPPEKELFDEFTPKLKDSEYNSDEYKENLKGLKVALDHHYKHNSHHPEHYEDGVNGMNLLDLIEMFFDWKAATERHSNGNIYESIRINKDRFNLSDQLCDILTNTVDYCMSGMMDSFEFIELNLGDGTPLTLDIIESYGFEKEVTKPDWDDVKNTYTLGNDLELSCLTVCGNEPCDVDELYGFDDYITIRTKEQLDELIGKTFEEICYEVKKAYPDFEVRNYL